MNQIAQTRIRHFSRLSPAQIDALPGLSPEGLTDELVRDSRIQYGSNRPANQKKDTMGFRLRRAFVNPFSVVLAVLAGISLVTDVILATNAGRNYMTFVIICSMLLISGTVRFLQELHSHKVTAHLTRLIRSEISVCRSGVWTEVDSGELVVGDRIRLTAGQRVPADLRLTEAEGCFVSQSGITGESALQAKNARALSELPERLTDFQNMLFEGTTLLSGSCTGIVLAVGTDTVYGGISADPSGRKDGFNRGANSIAWVLIRFMALLIPVVFVAGGLTRGNWMSAFLFALSVAVGLTPELLPMVITACLARGSASMGRKQTVVKNINAMQSFGSMDVLCVDKTGTLTGDQLTLEYYMDLFGNESAQVLDLAYLSSAGIRSTPNHLDRAILKTRDIPGNQERFDSLFHTYPPLAELPFDEIRKCSSVLLGHDGDNLLICKGDPIAVTARCNRIFHRGVLHPIQEEGFSSVHAVVDDMLEDGMKVLAVAVRETSQTTLIPDDETDLILMGYLAFFDVPKQSAAAAIRKLQTLHVDVKVLTGDHAMVAKSVCHRLGIDTNRVLTGDQLERLTDNEVQIAVEHTSVFAELSPRQKAEILALLRSNGHSVGFLGDGLNDLPAMLGADVGISVDTADPSVQEAADVILLKKDLGVLEEGILEGRRAFANMSKYIRITASSNLGNILAVVFASVLLPFFPMTAVQLLLLNLLYDLLCLILPWDRVDPELVEQPLEWSGKTLSRFMLYFGPISSVFDLLTFGFLLTVLCPTLCGGTFGNLSPGGQAQFVALFQTGWFLESMWTQVLILYLLRTPRLSPLRSRPSWPVLLVTGIGVTVLTVLAMTPVGQLIGLTGLPTSYFLFLIVTVSCYLLAVTAAKHAYLRRYRRLF